MRTTNTPLLDGRYWVAIVLASVFGCNTGDDVSHLLGLGYVRGLPFLAAAFACILLVERRAKAINLYYWLAIIVVRTAATNLGDFTTDEMEWDYARVSGALIAALAATVAIGRRGRDAGTERGLPAPDAAYWLGMLLAGTLGTVLGDETTYTLGIGPAILCLGAITAMLVGVNLRTGYSVWLYWPAIVAVRAVGTDLGDFVAFRKGLSLGLPMATALTGAAFSAVVLLWRPVPAFKRGAIPPARSPLRSAR